MPDRSLAGRRILIVEDEYLVADALQYELESVGIETIGPVGTIGSAIVMIAAEPVIHGAILDLSLDGKPAFAVADALIARDIPLIFVTGHDRSHLPCQYREVAICQKPAPIDLILQTMARVVGGRAGAG